MRVLLATDSAGEGIDLQAHCHRLVNFDIPFNPSRLEQRIGRIDRYGQHADAGDLPLRAGLDVHDLRRGHGLHGPDRREGRQRRADLGSVNQVIDADIQQHFARGHRRRARRKPRTTANAVINRALAGGLELNRRLTELSRTLRASARSRCT